MIKDNNEKISNQSANIISKLFPSVNSCSDSYEIPVSALNKLPSEPPPLLPYNFQETSFPDDTYEYLAVTPTASLPQKFPQTSPHNSQKRRMIFWSVLTILNVFSLLSILLILLVWKISPQKPDFIPHPLVTSTVYHKNSKCENGYTYYETSNLCYKVSVIHSSFDKAVKECHSDGSQLASIHSSEQNDFARGMYKSALAKYRYEVDIFHKRADLWIGFHYNKNSSEWGWLDESPINYTNWAENEPNLLETGEFCTYIGLDEIEGYNTDGDKWNNIGCSRKAAFICQKPAK